MKEKTPKSIVIIWILTAIAVFLSILSVVGLIISRSERIKKNVFQKFQKYGIYIQDANITFFPAYDGFEISLKGTKWKNKLSFDSLKISGRKIYVENLEFGSASCEHCEIQIGLNSKLFAEKLYMNIKGGGGKIDLSPICKIKELLKKRYTSLPLSLTFETKNSRISERNVNINISEGEIYLSKYKVFGSIGFITLLSENVPKISGKINIDGRFPNIDAKVSLSNPVDGSGRLSLSFCKGEKQLVSDFSISLRSDLTFASEFLGKNITSTKSDFFVSGNLEISKDGVIIISANSNGFIQNLYVSENSFGNFVVQLSLSYDGKKLSFTSKTESDFSRKFIVEGVYNPSQKMWDIAFSGNVDASKLPLSDIDGVFSVSGKFQLPKFFISSDVKLSSFKYDIINVHEGKGKINITKQNIIFDFDVNQKGSSARWRGGYNLKRGVLTSSASFSSASLKNLLDIVSIDLPLDGYSNGDFSIKIKRNNLDVFGKVISFNNFAFGEKIECFSADVISKVNLKSGDFSVIVKGFGSEEKYICTGNPTDNARNSLVYFDASVDKSGYSVSLSGNYDLAHFDMLDLAMRGYAEFEGKIQGNINGKTQGEITLHSKDIKLADYPVSSSCVDGRVLISEKSVDFEGKSCEEFSISATYLLNSKKIFAQLSKGNILITLKDDKIQGYGNLEEISHLIPLLGRSKGTFEAVYNLKKESGKIKVISPFLDLQNVSFEDVDFSGNIKRGIMNFSVSGVYSDEKFSGIGKYSLKSKDIDSTFYIKSFAGIPVSGNLRVSGKIDNLYFSGRFKVKDVEISDERIAGIFHRAGGNMTSPESESKGNLNIKLELENITYKNPLLKINVDGELYVVGALENPRVFGILEVKDGNFTLADTVFSNIKGFAFVRDENIFINISTSTDIITFEGEKFSIQVRIIGDINSPKVYLSSSPYLAQSDIICVLALYRRCASVDEFNKILGSVIYRNISLISRNIIEGIGLKENFKVVISPSDVGVMGKVGDFDVAIMQNIFDNVRRFTLSRKLSQNYQLILSWDDKKYGYSILGNAGNIGIDIRTKRKF